MNRPYDQDQPDPSTGMPTDTGSQHRVTALAEAANLIAMTADDVTDPVHLARLVLATAVGFEYFLTTGDHPQAVDLITELVDPGETP